VPGARPKSGIDIHHTVGGSARTTFELWRTDRNRGGRPRLVGTACIVDRDGTVFEVFDPAAWAYQFALTGWTPPARIRFEQRFIGIEIASEGALIEHDGDLYAFGSISPRTRKPGTKRSTAAATTAATAGSIATRRPSSKPRAGWWTISARASRSRAATPTRRSTTTARSWPVSAA
jgi:hypothetical protein